MNANELTDEEIYGFTHRMIICSGQNPSAADINIFGLARIVEDILRKAQEKTTQSVMAENCTCYKLGYSQLNNYRKVENENNNEAA
jgi:hypothetical protein